MYIGRTDLDGEQVRKETEPLKDSVAYIPG